MHRAGILTYAGLLTILFACLTSLSPAQEASAPRWEPKVAFSGVQNRTCVIDMGDEFPAATLNNLAGEEVDLGGLSEDALSVIAFWNGTLIGGVQLRNTIVREVAGTNAQLITVYLGTDENSAKQIAEHDPEAVGTHLIDGGQLWEQVARKADPPRVFLLKGREVVWLDIEYSLGTRQELRNAIRHYSE